VGSVVSMEQTFRSSPTSYHSTDPVHSFVTAAVQQSRLKRQEQSNSNSALKSSALQRGHSIQMIINACDKWKFKILLSRGCSAV
jgi:hypothetical protein